MSGQEAAIRDSLVAAIFRSDLGTRDTLILIAFALSAEIEGHVFSISDAEIARDSRSTLWTVRRGLARMVRQRILRRLDVSNADAHAYTVHLECAPQKPPYDGDDEAHLEARAARWYRFMEGKQP